MDLELRTHYWDDPESSAAFRKFMIEIHGLDFSEWASRGYWDDAYTPFSLFDGGTVVASVCVYLLDAVVDGEATRLAQISGVGTRREWRRRGLGRRLNDLGLQWAVGKHEGVFLFANEEAVPFYERCGFHPITECLETSGLAPASARRGAVRLNPGRRPDLDRIYRYAMERAPVSERFAILNAKLVMFHVLYSLRDCVFEIPDLDCLVFCARKEGTLSVYDVVGARVPRLDELYPYLADESDRAIEFHFSADRLCPKERRARPLDGNHPMVRGPFPVARPVFPFTARA